jgi:hypothetical protein
VNLPAAQGDTSFPLSRDCSPASGQLVGTVPIELALTTGTSTLTGPMPCPGQAADDACGASGCGAVCTGSACVGHTADGQCIDEKGGLSQLCCVDATDTPCFPTAGGGSILRTGITVAPLPAWPDPSYPKVSTGSVLVATFCAQRLGAIGMDPRADLPAPGAIILPVNETVLRVQP